MERAKALPSDFLICVSLCPILFIFQTMNYVRSFNLSLKYQRFTPSVEKIKELENLSLWQKLNSF